MLLHHIEEAADVALRVPASIRARAVRFDQVRVLVEHQRARVSFQDLGCDADRVKGLVDVAERLMLRPRLGHDFHLNEPKAWMMAGPSSTIHSTGKMHPTMGKTIREDACAARS